MGQGGAIAEVSALLARHLLDSRPVMRAIGVPEIAAFLRGDMTREEAICAGQQATRNYAKRQYTWARNQNPGDWPRLEYENSIETAHIESLLREYSRLTPHFVSSSRRVHCLIHILVDQAPE